MIVDKMPYGNHAMPDKPLPSSFRPAPEPIAIDHPRGREYQIYAARRRFPKPFWEWLEETERREQELSPDGLVLQRWMDEEEFCKSPLKARVHKGGRKWRRKLARRY